MREKAAFSCRLNPETLSKRVTHGVCRSSATVGIPLLQASVDNMDCSTGTAHNTHQHGRSTLRGREGLDFYIWIPKSLTYCSIRHSGRMIDGDAVGRLAEGHLIEQMTKAKDIHSFHGLWGEEQTA